MWIVRSRMWTVEPAHTRPHTRPSVGRKTVSPAVRLRPRPRAAETRIPITRARLLFVGFRFGGMCYRKRTCTAASAARERCTERTQIVRRACLHHTNGWATSENKSFVRAMGFRCCRRLRAVDELVDEHSWIIT